jgi:hypothetical protein
MGGSCTLLITELQVRIPTRCIFVEAFMIRDKGEYSVILVDDYDSRRFVATGAAEGVSAARSCIEESL